MRRQVTNLLNDMWLKRKVDHQDPRLNSTIQLLKKASEARNSQDLFELMHLIKGIEFFKQEGITGRDLLDVCEFVTYAFKDDGEEVVEFDD